MEMLKLTEEDWTEIFYALESKKLAVEAGDFGPDENGDNWAGHLIDIMEKIGPDGALAASKGVEPVGCTI